MGWWCISSFQRKVQGQMPSSGTSPRYSRRSVPAFVQARKQLAPNGRIACGRLWIGRIDPFNSSLFGVDILDPYQNVDGGERYQNKQYRTFGSWRLGSTAYNAGLWVVKKYGGVSPFKETLNYVKVIWGSWPRLHLAIHCSIGCHFFTSWVSCIYEGTMCQFHQPPLQNA